MIKAAMAAFFGSLHIDQRFELAVTSAHVNLMP